MKTLLTLSTLAATPAMAHSAANGLHIAHEIYLLAVVTGIVALAAYKYLKR
ncbi:MAG: hypothetical protein V3V13_13105 [Paracoccaceae bacterium]